MRLPLAKLFERALSSTTAVAAVLILSTVGLPHPGHAAELRAGAVFQDRVERVVDGDTLVLSELGRVRMIGMNTPETDRGAGAAPGRTAAVLWAGGVGSDQGVAAGGHRGAAGDGHGTAGPVRSSAGVCVP